MSDDYEQKVRRGQAMNLAVAAAIELGKPKDHKIIIEHFLFYMDVGELLQKDSIEGLRSMLEE